MRVLVCGSRDWDDPFIVATILQGLLTEALMDEEGLVVIDGGARGADGCARTWYGGREDGVTAIHDHVRHETYPADWKQHGKAAGPKRNQRMLDEGKPQLCFAFKNHLDPDFKRGGTEDMINRCFRADIPTYHVEKFG